MHKANETLTSMIALLVCGLILLSMTAMSLPKTRELASADLCRNNLKRLTLSVHNYHSAYKRMPPAVGGTSGASGYPVELSHPNDSNQGRLSGFAAILPFMEQQAAWEQLTNRKQTEGFPPMGPAPSCDPSKYKLWAVQFDGFICASDPAQRRDYGLRSYMMNYGDAVDSVGRLHVDNSKEDQALQRVVGRGAFVPHVVTKFRDCLDGLSNTLMLSETMIGVGTKKTPAAWIARDVDGLVNQPSKAVDTVAGKRYRPGQAVWSVSKGSRWPEGTFVMNAFTTVLPPGGPSATLPQDPESGCVAASSYHSDGVNVAMCDGGVRFVSSTIDVGDLNAPSVSPLNDNAGAKSPYGVWGAMGTRGSKEIIPSEREARFKRY